MLYYYNDLFDDDNINFPNRHIEMEKMFTYKLLSNIDSLINYINTLKYANGSSDALTLCETKLKTILRIFFKSNIFITHWSTFSRDFALTWTSDYIN